MRKRSERSLVLFALVFVFACLLFSGGSRLIGHEGEIVPPPAGSVSLVRAAFCAAPAPISQTGHVLEKGMDGQYAALACAQESAAPRAVVLSDANGNVLGSASYMHAVYQAFTLGDGFV